MYQMPLVDYHVSTSSPTIDSGLDAGATAVCFFSSKAAHCIFGAIITRPEDYRMLQVACFVVGLNVKCEPFESSFGVAAM